MSSLNKVIAGDYEGYSIIANAILSPILAAKRQSSGLDIKADENDVEILLIPKNIKSYKIIPSKNEETQLVDVIFRDGKRSLLQLDNSAYETFIKKNFNLDAEAAPKKTIILGAINESNAQSLDKDEVKKDAVFSENKEFINIQQGKTVDGVKISSNSKNKAEPFYKKGWFVLLTLLFIYPVGVILLWTSKKFALAGKVICSIIFLLIWLPGFMASVVDKPNGTQKQDVITSQEQQSVQQEETKQEEVKAVDPASKIQKGADSPMTQESYPKTYKTWGRAYFNRLNEMMPKVALKAAESDKCDMVTWVGLSDSRSTPKKEAVFFADCKNGERFYISENDLKTDKKAESVQEQTGKNQDGAYIIACRDYTKDQMNHPSTFDYSLLNTTVYRAPDTGRVLVTMPFEAKNSFNLKLEMTAKCYFDDRGLIGFEVNEN